MLKCLSSLTLVLVIFLQVQIQGYLQSFQRFSMMQHRSPALESRKKLSVLRANNQPSESPNSANSEEEEVQKLLEDIAGQQTYEKKTGLGGLSQLFTYRGLQLEARNESFSYVPIYSPGSYPRRALAALTYLIPLIDAADLGKYMFEAYPEIGSLYNSAFAPFIAIYNGVPFLPFAVFFAMAYVARGPQFPTEIRFHISQAFVLSLVQFIPSVLFPFMERAAIPGMAVWYNTMFLFVTLCSLNMQALLLLPFGSPKNPVVLNTLGLTLNIMNRQVDPFLKAVRPAVEEQRDDKL